jgi:hypothetical protein
MNDSTPALGRLQDVPATDAWQLEDRHFTPWLAANLDRLSEEIGLDLELEATEEFVGRFRADILARDVRGDRLVLIENQLEGGDHKHLGQIMTYLAGLNTQVMIWIATSFTDEHLSAVRWLNAHTVEPFSFFAVRVRVVRIGDSMMAPLFEVLEKPNDWERTIQEEARTITGQSELGQKRKAFWTGFIEQYPDESVAGVTAASSRWHAVPDQPDVLVAQYLSREEVGIFVRAKRGMPAQELVPMLAVHQQALEARLGAPMGPNANDHFFGASFNRDTNDRENWPDAFEWLHLTTEKYIAVLQDVLGSATNQQEAGH